MKKEINYKELYEELYKYTGSKGKNITDLHSVCIRDSSVDEWKEDVLIYLINFYKNFKVFAMNTGSENKQLGHKEMLLKMIEFIDKS